MQRSVHLLVLVNFNFQFGIALTSTDKIQDFHAAAKKMWLEAAEEDPKDGAFTDSLVTVHCSLVQ